MKKPSRGRVPGILDAGVKNYAALSGMTWIIWNAATKGELDLDAAFTEGKKGKKNFNDQLRVLIGVCTWSGTKAVPVREAEEFFSNNTRRSNFAHRLRQCAQAAAGIIDLNASAEIDKKTGILRISGAKVADKLNGRDVLLNEREASFTWLAALAKEQRGIVAKRGSNTRGVAASVSLDSQFEEYCIEFVGTVKKLGDKLSNRQSSALKAVSKEIQIALAKST
jgi:hypothetical protein